MKKFSLVFVLFFFATGFLLAQRTISGTVVDDQGEVLIGATVLLKGTTTGTITDVDGKYSLEVPSDVTELMVSYTGFQTQAIAIDGASNVVDVTMSIDAVGLEDVIVVGYGEQSKKYKVQSIASISSKEIENVPAISPQQLLQGQAAGVQMTNTSGVLGAASAIRIRGVASINAGGQPLFVVDGLPLNDGDYSNDQGAVALNPLQDINPNDIESISVLKDAAAAAIYGSRGANGVVLITTKKGKANQNKISLDYYTGWSTPTGRLDMLSADQFTTFQDEYNGNTLDPADGFDWVDAVHRTGKISSYSVSASGGSDKTQYYLGGTYSDQSNYVIGNDLEKLSGRLNFKHTISDRLRFGANIGLSRATNDRINSDNSTFAPLTSAILQNPRVAAFNDDGTYTRTGFIANVLAIEDLSVRDLISRRSFGNVYAKLDIIDNLTFTTDWGIDNIQTEETIRDPDIVGVGGYGYKEINQDIKWLTTNTLDYTHTSGKNYFQGLIGISFETSQLHNTTVEGSDFAADALRNIGSAATPTTTFSSRTEWALFSQFLRLNYRYDDKYLLEASLRRDGSSRFGADNRWGNFWAIGGGWILTEEDFLQGNGFFNNLKLSASYGVSGNDRLENFESRGLYQSGVDSDYAGNPGLRPTQAENPDLKWEQTSQFDIGISAAVLNSRLSIDLHYYVKNTKDLLLEFQLPETAGISSITRNAGKMKNSGIDLDISSVNIRRGKFEWSTRFNIGFLTNEVTELPGASLDDEGREFIAGSASQRAIVGESVNTFYLIRYQGINAQTGEAEWLDKDGNVTTAPTPADRVIAGSAIADFTGGLTNTFSWNGIDVSAFFNFSYGNDVYLGDLRFSENVGSGFFNKSTEVLNYWRNPGDNAFAPGADAANKNVFNQRSTLQLMNGNYLRLKNLTIGYTFPKSVLGDNIGISSARIYIMGQNIATIKSGDFRGVDPEVSDSGADNQIQGESFFTPAQAKIWTVGASVTF